MEEVYLSQWDIEKPDFSYAPLIVNVIWSCCMNKYKLLWHMCMWDLHQIDLHVRVLQNDLIGNRLLLLHVVFILLLLKWVL